MILYNVHTSNLTSHFTDILAKTFYAWIHVRNLGTVMKNDIDRAITYHDKRLMKRVFNAWYFTKVSHIREYGNSCQL